MLLPFRRPVAGEPANDPRRSGKGYSAIGLLLLFALHPADTRAQHGNAPRSEANATVHVGSTSTDRFRDVALAQAEGYVLRFACVTGPEARTTGLYFVNHSLVADGKIDADHPEVIIYAPMSDGALRLLGFDYLVPYDVWHATHTAPPQLFDEQFRVVDTPNPFRMRAFDTLHIAVAKNNRSAASPEWWDATVTCGMSGKINLCELPTPP